MHTLIANADWHTSWKEHKRQKKSGWQRTKETTTGIQRDGIDSKVKAMDKDRDNAEVPMREHMEC